ncbi:MAG: hypothetical protein R2789_16150 [Microthrixaceae bacterium]
MTARSIPRMLHPGAWWIWALGMATAASRTTNLVLLALILAVVALVVAARRGPHRGRGFKYYLYLALIIIAVRVVFRVLLDAGAGTTELFTLPELPLPEAAAGIRIGVWSQQRPLCQRCGRGCGWPR